MWMLYHVPDLDRASRRSAGCCAPAAVLAVTNGDEHVADLRSEAGGGPW